MGPEPLGKNQVRKGLSKSDAFQNMQLYIKSILYIYTVDERYTHLYIGYTYIYLQLRICFLEAYK